MRRGADSDSHNDQNNKQRRHTMTINLNLGCSLEAMKTMKDNSYDLAVVDPPYGIGNWIPSNTSNQSKKKETVFNKVNWNNTAPPAEYFQQLKRVSKKQIIWGANYFKGIFPSPVLVWYKNMGHPQFSQVEIASLSWGKKCDYVHLNWAPGFHRVMLEGKQIHPCQKPIGLYHWIYSNYAQLGMKILDTHLGSGSSAIAAHDCGLHFDGWEIDTEYYTAAVSRYNEHTRQMKLFT